MNLYALYALYFYIHLNSYNFVVKEAVNVDLDNIVTPIDVNTLEETQLILGFPKKHVRSSIQNLMKL